MTTTTDLSIEYEVRGNHVWVDQGRCHVGLSLPTLAFLRRAVESKRNTTGWVSYHGLVLDESHIDTLQRALDPALREACRRDGCDGWATSPLHDGLCPPHFHNDPNED